MLLQLLLMVVSFSFFQHLARSARKASPAHPAFMAFIAFMLVHFVAPQRHGITDKLERNHLIRKPQECKKPIRWKPESSASAKNCTRYVRLCTHPAPNQAKTEHDFTGLHKLIRKAVDCSTLVEAALRGSTMDSNHTRTNIRPSAEQPLREGVCRDATDSSNGANICELSADNMMVDA